ncbi:MAG: hypothetical protein HY924_15305, partial [Elusimicrobia bacterium]|nr:hypothetical protein [Elusimicrobiota bacterium]
MRSLETRAGAGLRRALTALLGLGACVTLTAGWGLAGVYSSQTHAVSPGGADSGGAPGPASETHSLSGSAGEVVFTTMTSETHRLRAGFLELRSYPGKVADLSGLSLTSTTLTAAWSAPGYSGGQGVHAAGSRYLIQRETDSEASFSYVSAQVDFSTSGAQPGEAQSRLMSSLSPNTTYFFHLWTRDADGNLSYASNKSTAATLPILVSTAEFKGVFTTSATLTWPKLAAAPPTATAKGYKLEASSTNFGLELPGGQTFSSATYNIDCSTLTVEGLAPDSTYYFRVGSTGHDDRANYLLYDSTLTRKGAVAPINVIAQGVESSQLAMSWNPVNSDAGYRAEASTDASDFDNYISSAHTHLGDTSLLVIPDLLPNTTYFLRVASLWVGTTKYSEIQSTTTLSMPAVGPYYNAVHITSATATWLPLALSPPDASSKTCQGYRLEASTTNFGSLSPGGVVRSSQTRNPALAALTVDDLEVKSAYYFRVAVLNFADSPRFTTLESTATLASPPGAGAPAVASVALSSASASWTQGSPANPAGSLYELRASSTLFAEGTAVASSQTYNLAGSVLDLLPDTTYQLRVRVLNPGNTPAETVLGSTVTWAQAPTAPSLTSVFASSAAAAWGLVTSQGYRLEASSTNFGSVLPGGELRSSVTYNGGLASLTVQNLDSHTTYYFRVGSLNWNSHPHYAVISSSITAAKAVSSVQVYRSFESSATLNWAQLLSTPQSETSAGYRLEASSTDFGALSPGGQVLSSQTANVALSTLTAADLLPDTTYFYRAGALNWAGHPNFVAGFSSATLASQVSDAAFFQVDNTSVTASWTPVSSQGYDLQASVNASFSPIAGSSLTANGSVSRLSVLAGL